MRPADARHRDDRKVSSSSSSSSFSGCERGLRRRLTGIAVAGLLAFSACSPANVPGDQPTGDASSADSTSSGDHSSTGGVDAGSGGSGGSDTGRKTYKIGWQGPLSGDNQEVGTHEANGARLAVEQANAADLGFTLELVESDDMGFADKAPAAAARLIRDPAVLGVVGPALSGPATATGGAYADAHMGLISGSAGGAGLTSSGFTTFHRIIPTDAVEGGQVGEWLATRFQKVFVVDDTTSYGRGIGDAVDATLAGNGVRVIRQGVPQNTQDYGVIAQRVTASGAQALFYAGYDAQAALIAKALASSGFKGLKMAGSAGKTSVFTTGAGPAGDGWYFSCGCQDATSAPAAANFAAAYQQKFNTPPSTYSPEYFDATNAMIEAVKAAVANGTPTRQAVVDGINSLDYTGITTQVKFAPDGEVAAATVNLYQQTDGTIVMRGRIQDQS